MKANGLKVSRKKAVLVQRILERVPEERLKTIFTNYRYELTDYGKKVLQEHEYIPYNHSNRIDELDIYSLSEAMQGKPGYRYRDIIWEFLNERSVRHMENRDFRLYRNCRLSMAEFVSEEGKQEYAFSLLFRVVEKDLRQGAAPAGAGDPGFIRSLIALTRSSGSGSGTIWSRSSTSTSSCSSKKNMGQG